LLEALTAVLNSITNFAAVLNSITNFAVRRAKKQLDLELLEALNVLFVPPCKEAVKSQSDSKASSTLLSVSTDWVLVLQRVTHYANRLIQQ
jgi:hypothetical protein